MYLILVKVDFMERKNLNENKIKYKKDEAKLMMGFCVRRAHRYFTHASSSFIYCLNDNNRIFSTTVEVYANE